MVAVNNTGQHESKRLAGAGLRDAHHVMTLQGDGPTLGLNRCRLLVARTTDLLGNVVGEVAVGKLIDRVRAPVLALHDCDLVVVADFLNGLGVGIAALGRHVVEVLLKGLEVVVSPVDGAQVASRLSTYKLHSNIKFVEKINRFFKELVK